MRIHGQSPSHRPERAAQGEHTNTEDATRDRRMSEITSAWTRPILFMLIHCPEQLPCSPDSSEQSCLHYSVATAWLCCKARQVLANKNSNQLQRKPKDRMI